MRKSRKILFWDTETTGLNPDEHGLVQMAVIMDIDGEKVGELQVNIQPFNTDILNLTPPISWELAKVRAEKGEEDGYLPVIEISVPILITFDKPKVALIKILRFLNKYIKKFDKTDKAYICGYNPAFDMAFISQWFTKCDYVYLGSYINGKQLNPLSMLHLMDYKGEISLPNYQLGTVSEYFQLELEAHNPLSDINVTRQLFYILQKNDKEFMEKCRTEWESKHVISEVTPRC